MMPMSIASAMRRKNCTGDSGFIPKRSQVCGGITRMPSAPASCAAQAWSIASRVPSALIPDTTVTRSPTSSAMMAVTCARSSGRNDVISPVWPLPMVEL